MNYTIVSQYTNGRQVTGYTLEEGDYLPGCINYCVCTDNDKGEKLGYLQQITIYFPHSIIPFLIKSGVTHQDDCLDLIVQAVSEYIAIFPLHG